MTSQQHLTSAPSLERPGVIRLPDGLLTVLGVVTVVVVAASPPRVGGVTDSPLAGLITLGCAAVVLLFRTRAPVLVAVAVTVAGSVAIVLSGVTEAATIAAALAVYTVGRRTARRTTVITAVVVIGTLVFMNAIFMNSAFNEAPEKDFGSALVVLAYVGFAAALGDANRSRRDYIDAVQDRAIRAERTRESEARRRVAEERVAIARDLHDLLAHQISVINLHANVASGALPDRVAEAERSLAVIRDAARVVLREMSGLLRVLRSDGGQRTPTPGNADLDELIESFRAAGLRVEVTTTGADNLDEPVGTAAYRVLQEALTNAHKHGSGSVVRVRIEHAPEELIVSVVNASDPDSGATGGHGLIGMRERVESVAGQLESGYDPDGVYRLVARLPR